MISDLTVQIMRLLDPPHTEAYLDLGTGELYWPCEDWRVCGTEKGRSYNIICDIGESFPEAEVSPGHVQGEARPGAAEDGGGV